MAAAAPSDGDEYADMADFEEEGMVNVDEAALSVPGYRSGGLFISASEPDDSGAILRTRTYDLSITYDKYYQTPRVWLFGYSESGQPLTPDLVFQDIMQDCKLRCDIPMYPA